jgi:hypothetical protein
MAKEKNNKPSRKKIGPKTPSSSLSAIDTKEVLLQQDQQLELEEVIKQAFIRFSDAAQLKQYKVKDLEHIDAIVTEFLKSFMILGYDLNGEKVFIMHATNPHDRDALVEHLRTTLLGIINSQG